MKIFGPKGSILGGIQQLGSFPRALAISAFHPCTKVMARTAASLGSLVLVDWKKRTLPIIWRTSLGTVSAAYWVLSLGTRCFTFGASENIISGQTVALFHTCISHLIRAIPLCSYRKCCFNVISHRFRQKCKTLINLRFIRVFYFPDPGFLPLPLCIHPHILCSSDGRRNHTGHVPRLERL